MNLVFKPQIINSLLEKREISKRTFCKDIQISYAKYQHWLKTPSTMQVDDLINVCAFFNVSTSVFIVETANESSALNEVDLSNMNDLVKRYIKENKDEAIKYERKMTDTMVAHQKEISLLNENHIKEISDLKLEHFKKENTLEMEIKQLKAQLEMRLDSQQSYPSNAAENETKYNKKK